MAGAETVRWRKKEVREYLDGCIRHWRQLRDDNPQAFGLQDQCKHYIDAFQSVRTSLFGETLPEEPIGDPTRGNDPTPEAVIGNPNR